MKAIGIGMIATDYSSCVTNVDLRVHPTLPSVTKKAHAIIKVDTGRQEMNGIYEENSENFSYGFRHGNYYSMVEKSGTRAHITRWVPTLSLIMERGSPTGRSIALDVS